MNVFRNIVTVETDDEDDVNETIEDESGIVSESVSASSVIQMFGGIGKFKKSPTSVSSPTTPTTPTTPTNEFKSDAGNAFQQNQIFYLLLPLVSCSFEHFYNSMFDYN